MGLHDELARKAFARGDGRDNFLRAAQQHANATWVCVIAALAVWYFLGWAWALVPAVLGVYAALKSVSATMVATRLENMDRHSAP